VLSGKQIGLVFANCVQNPSRFYVQHGSGFSQIFGDPDNDFDKALETFLLRERVFSVPKIRLYTPAHPGFLKGSGLDSFRSERQRFHWKPGKIQPVPASSQKLEVRRATESDLSALDKAFSLTTRFWNTPREFLELGRPQVVFFEGQPAALSYAAAEAGGQVEIDVFSHPNFRRKGLAAAAVRAFLLDCETRKVDPVWDCFTNNLGSVKLCRNCGFFPRGEPYAFYTIPRHG